MRLIVGLGNPGAQYERTRHNVGWRVLDAFAKKYRLGFDGHEKDALLARGRVAGRAVLLAKPLTFMNLSGKSVALLVRAYADALSDVLVVYDDVDLPLGRLRIRERGSAGTHNGMESVVAALESDEFPRLRFGVRGPTHADSRDLARYVLEDFEPDEEPAVEDAIGRAIDALLFFVRDDLRRAMNTFNRDPATESDTDEQTSSHAR